MNHQMQAPHMNGVGGMQVQQVNFSLLAVSTPIHILLNIL